MGESEQDTVKEAWEQWFENQWDLTHCIDEAVKKQSAERGDGFRAALYSAVIEHCAEALRAYIPEVTLVPFSAQPAPAVVRPDDQGEAAETDG